MSLSVVVAAFVTGAVVVWCLSLVHDTRLTDVDELVQQLDGIYDERDIEMHNIVFMKEEEWRERYTERYVDLLPEDVEQWPDWRPAAADDIQDVSYDPPTIWTLGSAKAYLHPDTGEVCITAFVGESLLSTNT